MVVFLIVYLFICIFLVVVFVWFLVGKDCQILNGKWYNQLGFEIFLRYENDGRLFGEYRMVVERKNGLVGEIYLILLGEYENLFVYN